MAEVTGNGEHGSEGAWDVETLPKSPASIALWNFSSQWFLVPQGTGIVATILHQLAYQFNGLRVISEVIWVYTIVLLCIFVFCYLIRAVAFPRHVARVLKMSIVETSCLSSISITFTTIIQMIALTIVHNWGRGWGIAAYVLWSINTAMAVIACFGIPYIQVKLQPPGIKAVSPVILLPLIAALTSAAGAGVLCTYGELSDRLQVPIIIISYLEIGAGLPLAISMVGLFQTRLFDQSFPSFEQTYQDMILCGPFGQSSFALLILGKAIQDGSFSHYDRGTFLTAEAATPIGFASQLAGLLTWGYGTFWWAFGILSILHAALAQPGGIRNTKFTMSAWSLVFPWGVYTNAAVQLGQIMNSPAFKVWSTVLLLLLLIILIVNHIFTIKGLITGKILGLHSGWKIAPARTEKNRGEV